VEHPPHHVADDELVRLCCDQQLAGELDRADQPRDVAHRCVSHHLPHNLERLPRHVGGRALLLPPQPRAKGADLALHDHRELADARRRRGGHRQRLFFGSRARPK